MRDSIAFSPRAKSIEIGSNPSYFYPNKMNRCPHPYRVRSPIHGFSHGLKSVHWTLFAPVCALVPPFRIPSHPLPITKATLLGGLCYWQRMRDSNPRERSQSPVCYRYTNPLSVTVLLYAKICKSQALFSHSSGFSSQGQGAPVRTSCFRYRKVSFSPFSASMVST